MSFLCVFTLISVFISVPQSRLFTWGVMQRRILLSVSGLVNHLSGAAFYLTGSLSKYTLSQRVKRDTIKVMTTFGGLIW